jgi:hypothetical protein
MVLLAEVRVIILMLNVFEQRSLMRTLFKSRINPRQLELVLANTLQMRNFLTLAVNGSRSRRRCTRPELWRKAGRSEDLPV